MRTPSTWSRASVTWRWWAERNAPSSASLALGTDGGDEEPPPLPVVAVAVARQRAVGWHRQCVPGPAWRGLRQATLLLFPDRHSPGVRLLAVRLRGVAAIITLEVATTCRDDAMSPPYGLVAASTRRVVAIT